MEKIEFGTKMIGQTFEKAFQDSTWVQWFVSHYEGSSKMAHRKFVRYVEMRLDKGGQGGAKGEEESEGVLLTSCRSTPKDPVRKVMDQCSSGCRGIGRRDAPCAVDEPPGRGGGVHASGESSAKQPLSKHGVSDGRDHWPPQEPVGQDRAILTRPAAPRLNPFCSLTNTS